MPQISQQAQQSLNQTVQNLQQQQPQTLQQLQQTPTVKKSEFFAGVEFFAD
jgi:hypothetical protein